MPTGRAKPQAAKWLRIAVLALLLALAATVFFILWHSPTGYQAMHHPHRIKGDAREWISHHRVIAPLAFIALYVLLAISMLPVWWLMVLGGLGFGLYLGVIYGQIAATCAATLTVMLAHWLAGDWIHQKIEAKREKLRHVDEILGNNGLLVVMATRLTHLMPFALSNYFFGLTRITVRDAALGTLVGGIPTTAVYVTIGADRKLLGRWEYWVILIGVNATLLVPLLIGYYRRKIRMTKSE